MNDELVVEMINEMIRRARIDGKISVKGISDGNHTFRELYNHRTILFAIVCNFHKDISWKSKRHFDEEIDPMFNGCFIAGINTPNGLMTYHIKLEYWDLFNIPELERAYPYDGHNNDDDLLRLLSLINYNKEVRDKQK